MKKIILLNVGILIMCADIETQGFWTWFGLGLMVVIVTHKLNEIR